MGKRIDSRIEKDSMGEMTIPEGAMWGPQTQRAVENFNISGYRFPRSFIRALGMVKFSAAKANMALGLLEDPIATALLFATAEMVDGRLDNQFILDIFQTGSGTSTNMNANEVISYRANMIMADSKGEKPFVHPNDHVNMSQSSNDVIPTCMHIAAVESIKGKLIPSLDALREQLKIKAAAFDHIVKIGRTHLQDATPVRLGQEFGGYASMVEHGIRRLTSQLENLNELALGGTAVGTGLNAHPDFARLTIAEINRNTSLNFREAENHFEAQGSKDAIVEISGTIKTIAVSLSKIANDLRWMGAGPFTSIGEINIPAVQPGSSIMPGKTNPVMIEALIQVAAQVIGNDAVITLSGLSGNFELNTMMPVMTYNLLSSIDLLTNAVNAFTTKCVAGITANEARCTELMEKSLAMVTALNPHTGYDAAAEIAKEAYKTGKTLRQVIIEKKLFSEEKLDEILDPLKMTHNLSQE